MHYDGVFHGEREALWLPGGRIPFWKRPPDPPPCRLKWWQWDLLGPVPFYYEIASGNAGNDYIDWYYPQYQTRMILGMVREHPAVVQFQYNGLVEPEREFYYGSIRLESVTAFRIKNAVENLVSHYYFIFFL